MWNSYVYRECWFCSVLAVATSLDVHVSWHSAVTPLLIVYSLYSWLQSFQYIASIYILASTTWIYHCCYASVLPDCWLWSVKEVGRWHRVLCDLWRKGASELDSTRGIIQAYTSALEVTFIFSCPQVSMLIFKINCGVHWTTVCFHCVLLLWMRILKHIFWWKRHQCVECYVSQRLNDDDAIMILPSHYKGLYTTSVYELRIYIIE